MANYFIAAELADSIGAVREVIKNYQHIHEVYAAQGNYKRAYTYFNKHNWLKDSLFNEDKSRSIGKLEAKHEFETAEAERERLEISE